MAAPRKLTDAQIQWARAAVEKWLEAERQFAMYPTLAQVAKELEVSTRYLQKIIYGKARQR